MARLVVINRSVAGSVHELGEIWTTVGRADGNMFQILEGSISGRHCEVRLKGHELAIRDLLSTNGTFIDGKKISEGVLKPGQSLRLGDVELRFEIALAAGSVANPAPAASGPPVNAPAKAASSPESGDGAGKKFNILLVDDSLAFLELFASLCAEYSNQTWQIDTASSADRALAVLRDKTTDLIILDVGMPMLDGLQLLNIINRRYPGTKVAVMTGNATEDKRADALAKGAEIFLEKPVAPEGMRSAFNVLNELVSWTRDGFTGALRHVGLQEIIQMECNGRHSSILEIRNPEVSGKIYIDAGVITHASVGDLAGEPAFYRLLSLRGGHFQVKAFKAPPQRTIESRWEFLLMDAARATDEETGMLTKAAASKASAPPPPDKPATDPNSEFVVVATYDGKWKPETGGK